MDFINNKKLVLGVMVIAAIFALASFAAMFTPRLESMVMFFTSLCALCSAVFGVSLYQYMKLQKEDKVKGT